MERVQKRAKKMIKEPPLWGKIEGVWSLIPREEKVLGELITIFQFLKGSYKEDGGTLHKEPHGEDKEQKSQIEWDMGFTLGFFLPNLP